ncbi:MAG: ArsB/NhaD family transporter [Candidatus Omnitrophica bacterium]|nr:ArsB/NhaD family transporter [Candidatus Omnitrophota bacterium]MDD5487837.1 ArsB/NhaD family transporter [Candidatus Omnitrophota bacterium]
MNALLSVVIFVMAYCLFAMEKLNKMVVAITGAALVVMLHLVSFEEAIASVDFNVIFLLVGMMTSVYILSKTGFFEWIAISIAKVSKGDPWVITFLLLSATAVLSALLDNVTTIILLAPVTILIMQLMEISPAPVIMLEAMVSNIGGTATLIGDPPNIIVGSKAGLSFNSFLLNLGPVVVVIFIAFVATAFFLFRKDLAVADEIKERLARAVPSLAIVDKPNMIKALAVMGLIFVGFFLHNAINTEPGIIALGGSMLMLIVTRFKPEETFVKIEWGVIFFFIGMFMMISALEVNGVIAFIGSAILKAAGHNFFMLCMIILWGSAIFSAILDNIPFVITMIPLIKHFSGYFTTAAGSGMSEASFQPIWWALVLGACLGGNGTLIGASANIVMAKIGERNKCPVTFGTFFKYGSMFMLQSMVICTFYLWLRYFH